MHLAIFSVGFLAAVAYFFGQSLQKLKLQKRPSNTKSITIPKHLLLSILNKNGKYVLKDLPNVLYSPTSSQNDLARNKNQQDSLKGQAIVDNTDSTTLQRTLCESEGL